MSQRRRNTVRKKAPRQILTSGKGRANVNGQYKRSLSVQALSSKEGVSRKPYTATSRAQALKESISGLRLGPKYQDMIYAIFAVLIAAFIIYSLLPWRKISTLLSDFTLGLRKSVSTQSGPLYKHSLEPNQPFLKLRTPNWDSQSEATARLSIKPGDSLKSTLLRHGFTSEESNAAQQALTEGSMLSESYLLSRPKKG